MASKSARHSRALEWNEFTSGSGSIINQPKQLELHPQAVRAFNQLSEALISEVGLVQRNKLEQGDFVRMSFRQFT